MMMEWEYMGIQLDSHNSINLPLGDDEHITHLSGDFADFCDRLTAII
jgi:hypothetical protein